MKTLYLLRHAKSSWDDDALADRDRPLAARGQRAAQRMAIYIKRAGIRPALVLCSSARRTRDTLDALIASLGEEVEVRIEEDLYGSAGAALLGRLRRVGARTPSVMLIGHNPGIQDLAIELAGDGDDRALRQLRTKFPTGALATLELDDVEWNELGSGLGYLDSVVLPAQLQ